MLRVLKHSMPYSRSGKQVSSHCLNLVERNRAILLMLLDTGVRSSELVALKISNSDLKNRRIPFSEAQLNWRSAWQFGGKDTKLLGDGGWQKLARAQVNLTWIADPDKNIRDNCGQQSRLLCLRSPIKWGYGWENLAEWWVALDFILPASTPLSTARSPGASPSVGGRTQPPPGS